MGMLSGIMGDASKIDVADVEKDFAPMLVAGETLSAAFKLVRDLLVFTDRRLILVDKQGVSGKKTEYMSVPYRHIVRFSTESAGGMLDHDAELRIWVMGSPDPIVKEFRKGEAINEVYLLLGQAILV
jgi:hypothetical protein